MAGRGTDIVLGGNLEAELKELAEKSPTEKQIVAVKADWKERQKKVLEAGGKKSGKEGVKQAVK